MSGEMTPGPWLALDYTNSDEPAWHVVPHDFHGTIATLDPEQSANARLIAAAPDLLAAASEALDFIEVIEGRSSAQTPLADRIRAAIAKARGQV